jgi:hypothetical protein
VLAPDEIEHNVVRRPDQTRVAESVSLMACRSKVVQQFDGEVLVELEPHAGLRGRRLSSRASSAAYARAASIWMGSSVVGVARQILAPVGNGSPRPSSSVAERAPRGQEISHARSGRPAPVNGTTGLGEDGQAHSLVGRQTPPGHRGWPASGLADAAPREPLDARPPLPSGSASGQGTGRPDALRERATAARQAAKRCRPLA